ncbi:MAG: hypothetical protein IJ137_05640 [Eubacterium sp.]|nr:hypothetical protein [Eubacterium sp.]
MQTNKVVITSIETGMREALEMTENLGLDQGLDKKNSLHLRLLAEELIGLMRGITDEASADYWIEYDGNQFELHLTSDVTLNRKMREEILSVSSTGDNAAAKGFMGKLKDMIAVALLPDESGKNILSGLSLGLSGIAVNTSPQAQQASLDALNWSMQRYKSAIEADGSGIEDIEEKKYELEHSIVASIADEVTASVKGSHVEVIIQKTF